MAPAAELDGPQAKARVDSQPEARRPERLLGDTAYGTQDVREEMEEREIEVLALPATSKTHPVFGKEEFEIDLEAATVTCPQGKVAAISKPNSKGERGAFFRRSDCRPCPIRGRCTKQDRRVVVLGRREDLLLAARQALEDPDVGEHLRRTRPRIERLLGLLAHRYGARRGRYFGKRKANLQGAWAAALVNLNPIGNAPRRPDPRSPPPARLTRGVLRSHRGRAQRTGFSDL